MGKADIVKIEISAVRLSVDLVAQRAALRARWSTPKHPNGWGVQHVEAGEFGQYVDGEFVPFRFESEDDASRWLDAAIEESEKFDWSRAWSTLGPLQP